MQTSLHQGRNEVRWRPGKEASLAPPCSNLSFRSKCIVLKKVPVTLLGLFGAPWWFGARGIVPPLLSTVTPLVCMDVCWYATYFNTVWKEACIRVVWLNYSFGQVDRSLTLTMDFSNLWKHWYRFTHASFHTVYNNYTWLTAISSHCLAALPAKISVFNSHMQGSLSVISNKSRLHTKKPIFLQ